MFPLVWLFPLFGMGQTLILNEVSQGETGGMEYVELVVVDSTVTYNCANTTPPCIDIRGWIIDDNSGYHGGSGIASGACRFSYDPLWSCVPVGTVILIYNDGDPNNQLLADDLSLADGNCSIVAPISSNLFETNSTTPGAVACDYPASGWTAGGNWTNIVMANGGDCFRIVDLSGCEVFSLCWDDNDQNNMIYFQGGATSTNSASNTVYYFNDGDPTDVTNWSIGCADQPNCGQQDQTPGAPNNAQNADFIAQFNNGCNPITPIEVLANVDQNSSCSCDGQATATSSGSIPGYTYEWYDDLFNPIGQTGSVATGLCGGTYYVIGTSSIDCSDTVMVTLSSSGSGVSGLVAPPVDTVECISLVAPEFLLFSDFLNDGGVLNGNISDVDTTSFGMIGQSTDGLNCPETITRTYELTDSCGNVFTVDHEIVVLDTTPPTGTAPALVTVQCIGDAPAADPTLITDEADNCTATPTVTYVGDVSDGNTCPETITRTYRIEDDCGNFIEVDQTITVNDDIAPTASNPATTTVACASDVPATDPTVVTDEADNCTANPTVTFISETSDNNVCNGEQLTRTYEVEDDCGNTSTVTHTIIIDSYTPTFTVAGTDPTTCGAADGFITISGLDPNTVYEVGYNGNTAQPVTTDANGEYVIIGLSAGSYTDFSVAPSSCVLCEATDATVINLVNLNAPAIDAGPDQEVCEGTEVTLTAGNPDGANISWDNGVTDGTPFTPGIGTTNYTVSGELNNCISIDMVTVTVNPLPNVEAGDNVYICEGEQVTLNASGAQTYVWDNSISNGVAFEPASTSTYSVVGTDINGCQNTDDVTVSISTSSSINFKADTTGGCVPVVVNFTNLTTGNSTECIYTFSDGTQLTGCNPTYTFTSPGCHDVTLEVTNDNGCVSSMTITDYICVEEAPIAAFTVDPGELTNLNNTAQFNNSSSGAYSYEWQFGDGGTSTQVNPEHIYPSEEDEDYEVQLIAFSELGCTDTTTTILPLREELLFFVPNSFTPDQNDYNETFKPVFTSGFDPMNYTLVIFNRWGEVIFESNNAEVGWDGTYGADSDQIVKDGTYVWKIVFKTKNEDDHREAIGHVNLLK